MKRITGVLFLLSLSSIYLSWKYFWMQIGWQITAVVMLAVIWFIAKRLKPFHNS